MHIKEFLKIIEEKLPGKAACEGDRIGLQIQSRQEKINKVLVAYEITNETINEAAKLKCDTILSFHPLIYYPLTDITETNRTGHLVTELIKNNIALITAHTNFDAFVNGTSRILCDRLGLIYEDFLVPCAGLDGFGMGVIAKPENPISPHELLDRVSHVCHSPLRWTSGKFDIDQGVIKKIAIVGGSGTSYMNDALKADADVFITADISYHRFHEVTGKMMLIDPGHYEMEQFVADAMAGLIKNSIDDLRAKNEHNSNENNKVSNVINIVVNNSNESNTSESDIPELPEIVVSKIRTNPVSYYPDTENYNYLQSFELNKGRD